METIKISKNDPYFEDLYVLIKSVKAVPKSESRLHLTHLMYHDGKLYNTDGKTAAYMEITLPGIDGRCYIEVISCTKSQILLLPISDAWESEHLLEAIDVGDIWNRESKISGSVDFVFCEICRALPEDRNVKIEYFLSFAKHFDWIEAHVEEKTERVVVVGGRVTFVQMFMRI